MTMANPTLQSITPATGKNSSYLYLMLGLVRLPLLTSLTESVRPLFSDGHVKSLWIFQVTFNPITVNSIRRTLSKICRHEQFEVGDEQIDLIAKASGGDIRSAITSLQYFCLKPFRMNSQSLSKSSVTHPEEDMDKNNLLNGGICLPFGRDETLSLFHALGKFLHNKRESGILSEPGISIVTFSLRKYAVEYQDLGCASVLDL